MLCHFVEFLFVSLAYIDFVLFGGLTAHENDATIGIAFGICIAFSVRLDGDLIFGCSF